MKATELRIGNLFDNHGAICHVMAIKINNAEFGYFEDSVGFERRFDNEILLPNPIPLTEEWLLKFGYKYEDTSKDESFNGRYKLNEDNYGGMDHCVEVRGKLLSCATTHVILECIHQLQNLVYALTGQELEIKKVA